MSTGLAQGVSPCPRLPWVSMALRSSPWLCIKVLWADLLLLEELRKPTQVGERHRRGNWEKVNERK